MQIEGWTGELTAFSNWFLKLWPEEGATHPEYPDEVRILFGNRTLTQKTSILVGDYQPNDVIERIRDELEDQLHTVEPSVTQVQVTLKAFRHVPDPVEWRAAISRTLSRGGAITLVPPAAVRTTGSLAGVPINPAATPQAGQRITPIPTPDPAKADTGTTDPIATMVAMLRWDNLQLMNSVKWLIEQNAANNQSMVDQMRMTVEQMGRMHEQTVSAFSREQQDARARLDQEHRERLDVEKTRAKETLAATKEKTEAEIKAREAALKAEQERAKLERESDRRLQKMIMRMATTSIKQKALRKIQAERVKAERIKANSKPTTPKEDTSDRALGMLEKMLQAAMGGGVTPDNVAAALTNASPEQRQSLIRDLMTKNPQLGEQLVQDVVAAMQGLPGFDEPAETTEAAETEDDEDDLDPDVDEDEDEESDDTDEED